MSTRKEASPGDHVAEGSPSMQDRLGFLAEVSRHLANSLDYETTLLTVAGMSLPYLGAWCVVDLVADAPPSGKRVEGDGDGGEIRRLAVLHPDARKQTAARELHQRYPPHADDVIGAPRVMRTGRSELVFGVSDAGLVASARDEEHLALLRELGVDAYVIAPMVARGRLLGAITFVTAETGRRFGDVDVLMAEDLANRAAMAVDNARLHRDVTAARDAAEEALVEAEVLAAALDEARELAEAERSTTSVRATRLQTLSTALSHASTEAEVAQAVVAHATNVLEAVGTVIARLAGDGAELEVMPIGALPEAARDTWQRFPAKSPTPMGDVARTGEPLFLHSRSEWTERYPELLPLLESTGHHANAVLPLVVDGRVIGVLGAAYDAPRPFDADDRLLALAVAQQCAQSLERARLLQAEREARREAEGASRAKGDFLAAMSHELRTPLNAIGGYAQLLEMGLYGPVTEEQRAVFDRVALAQRYLLRLVNDVLNFERLQAGRLEYDVKAVRLAELVADVEPLIRPQLHAKGLGYAADVPAECVVRADPDKLMQVLLNLLSNAVKFTPTDGHVRVECARREDGTDAPDTVYLRVADSGVGIPHDKCEAVFEPFVQVDATLAGRTGGAGLGLSISRDLVRGMGGDLRVRSTVGEGTAFTVALPRG